jgi:hypothetical protein
VRHTPFKFVHKRKDTFNICGQPKKLDAGNEDDESHPDPGETGSYFSSFIYLRRLLLYVCPRVSSICRLFEFSPFVFNSLRLISCPSFVCPACLSTACAHLPHLTHPCTCVYTSRISHLHVHVYTSRISHLHAHVYTSRISHLHAHVYTSRISHLRAHVYTSVCILDTWLILSTFIFVKLHLFLLHLNVLFIVFLVSLLC